MNTSSSRTPSIASEKYVSLTTYRRNGTPVHVPVWIASLDGGRVGFTTESESFKVKRIRNNPAVALRPCDMKGRVREGAVEIRGTATIGEGAEHDAVWRAIRSKYGVVAAVIGLWGTVKGRFTKSAAADCAVLITLS